jgi:hypothetical protein
MFKAISTMTVLKLKKLCHDENIPGYSNLKKKQLVQHVKTHKLNVIIKDGMSELLALK